MTPDLKALAIAARDAGTTLMFAMQNAARIDDEEPAYYTAWSKFTAAASPDAVLAMIEENERLREELSAMTDRYESALDDQGYI